MSILQKMIHPLGAGSRGLFSDLGLLLLRLFFGGIMLFGHGWGKLTGFGQIAGGFPDPLGVGSTLSLSLTVFAEFFCSLALIFGFMTRLASLPLIVTMLVAVFVIHIDDPFGKQELALLYLGAYFTLFLAGPGRFAVDARLSDKNAA